jgi:hypothetical protein
VPTSVERVGLRPSIILPSLRSCLTGYSIALDLGPEGTDEPVVGQRQVLAVIAKNPAALAVGRQFVIAVSASACANAASGMEGDSDADPLPLVALHLGNSRAGLYE